MTNFSTTAGIDTSKAKLDVAVHGRAERWHLDNACDGWCSLAAHLRRLGVSRVGIEASGGYENGVVQYLREQGFTVLLMQPIQVKAYRLIARGKAHNVTLIACARKLRVYANTVLQHGTPWADKTASA